MNRLKGKKLPVFLPAVWLSKQPGQVFDIILTSYWNRARMFCLDAFACESIAIDAC